MTAFQFNTPGARFIMGSLTEQQKTDHQGRPKPQDKWNYFFGIAIRKDDPKANELIGGLINMVNTSDYASKAPHVIQAANGVVQRNFPAGNVGFAWKVADGDAPGNDGKVNENSRGCWLLKFSSMYPIKCCDQQQREISPDQIKRGYYVDVAGSASINGNTDGTAGIYLNPQWVRLLGYGPEIVGGPTAEQAFAAAPASLPPGASATPVAGANAGFPQQAQPQGFPQQAQPQGFPQQAQPQGFPQQAQPQGFPQQAQPQGFPQQAVPNGGNFQSPPMNAPSATGFPSNPQTGMPVQPHNGFIPGR